MKNASVAVSVFLLFGSLSDAQATDLYTLGNGQDACSAWLKLRQNEHVHEGQVNRLGDPDPRRMCLDRLLCTSTGSELGW